MRQRGQTFDRSGPHPALVLTLFLLSGATGLVYEVVWLRQLILVFGATLYATSAILTAFMGGLALGAYAAGRWIDRHPWSPLIVYGLLEIGIGVYALAEPGLLRGSSPLYRWVWEAGGSESFLTLGLAKFAGIAAVLLPPTVLMGASLPVLARCVASDPRRIGGQVGTLYAVNTYGAVAGAIWAGLVALPGMGMSRTLRVNAAVNLALGLSALALGKRGAAPRGGVPSTEPLAPPARRPLSSRVTVALVAFALSGFAAMLLEVAWTRGLTLVFGSSVYAFSLMLVAFLLGLASGSAALSAFLRRRPGIDPGTLLAALLASAGAFAFATAFVLQLLPRLFTEIYGAWTPSPAGWLGVQLLFALLLMLPTTFALGGIFPAVLQLHARGLDNVARSVGTVYASNTLGTIVGAAAGGFLVVPRLGVADTIVATAALELGLALLMAGMVAALSRRSRAAIVATLVVALSLVPVVRPGWDTLIMNSGVYTNLPDLPKGTRWKDYLKMVVGSNKVLFAEEGLTASVMVADQPGTNNRYLAVNGKVDASTQSDLETQLLCGHLPLLFHRDPKDVLLVGLASGISAGAVATHPVRSLRVVEVEPAMLRAARHFADANRHVLEDPRVRISVNDARNDLEFSPQSYDVIVSQPSNPWMTVASNLFTEDFFRMARTRLRPDGVFCQWVQTYGLRPEDLRSILAAYGKAFPRVLVFDTLQGVDLLLLGSSEPLRFDLDRLDRQMAEGRIRADLERVEIRGALDVLAHFRAGDREVDRLTAGAHPNTDDNAQVEFSAPKALYLDTLDANLEMLGQPGADPLAYLAGAVLQPDDTDRIRLGLADRWLRMGQRHRAAAAARAALGGQLRAEAEAILTRARGK